MDELRRRCPLPTRKQTDRTASFCLRHSIPLQQPVPQQLLLLDAVAYFSPLIKQLENPEVPICFERAEEFFGQGWRQTFRRRGGLEKTSKTIVNHRRGAIKNMQAILKTGVQEGLRRIGLPPKVSTATNTFVYAAALHPDSVVVEKILDYLKKARDEGSEDQQVGGVDDECSPHSCIFFYCKRELGRSTWNQLKQYPGPSNCSFVVPPGKGD